MSLQSIAAKIMFKLPDPILGKIMKYISPKKETPIELDPKKPRFLQTIRGAGYVLWIE